jgi:hypothetical protein
MKIKDILKEISKLVNLGLGYVCDNVLSVFDGEYTGKSALKGLKE